MSIKLGSHSNQSLLFLSPWNAILKFLSEVDAYLSVNRRKNSHGKSSANNLKGFDEERLTYVNYPLPHQLTLCNKNDNNWEPEYANAVLMFRMLCNGTRLVHTHGYWKCVETWKRFFLWHCNYGAVSKRNKWLMHVIEYRR